MKQCNGYTMCIQSGTKHDAATSNELTCNQPHWSTAYNNQPLALTDLERRVDLVNGYAEVLLNVAEIHRLVVPDAAAAGVSEARVAAALALVGAV